MDAAILRIICYQGALSFKFQVSQVSAFQFFPTASRDPFSSLLAPRFLLALPRSVVSGQRSEDAYQRTQDEGQRSEVRARRSQNIGNTFGSEHR